MRVVVENCLTVRLNEVNTAKNGACSTPRHNLQQFYSPTSGNFHKGNFSTIILNHFLHHQVYNLIGLDRCRVRKLTLDLNTHSIQYATKIINTSRRLKTIKERSYGSFQNLPDPH